MDGAGAAVRPIASLLDGETFMSLHPQPHDHRMSESEFLQALDGVYARAQAGRQDGEPEQAVADRCQELELDLTIDFRLGRDYPEPKRTAIHDAHRVMWRGRDEALAQLMAGSLSPARYADRLQELLTTMVRSCEQFLGPEVFETFFDL